MDTEMKEKVDALVEYELNTMTVTEMMNIVMQARSEAYYDLPLWEIDEAYNELFGPMRAH